MIQTRSFVDFLKHPELIRTSLEDFIPFKNQLAVERFFELVEWMLNDDSPWETTESKFWSPVRNTGPAFPDYSVICSGRLVFFCRNHLWQSRHSDWLFSRLLEGLLRHKPVVPNACVGVFTVPTLFVSLSQDQGKTAPLCAALGVRCYGFGNTEDEAFDGFGSGVDAVRTCTQQIGEMLIASGDLV